MADEGVRIAAGDVGDQWWRGMLSPPIPWRAGHSHRCLHCLGDSHVEYGGSGPAFCDVVRASGESVEPVQSRK